MRVPDPEIYEIAIKEFNVLSDLKRHEAIIRVFDIFYNKN